MEIDANISDLLREVIAFLESLHDAQLPLTLESLREKLLTRSRETLKIATMTRESPEPYLDMNSGPKSLLLKKNEADSQEYVGLEESKKQKDHQDYYETFENGEQSNARNECLEQNEYPDETDEGQTLIKIYKNLSAAQIKSKCHKCGPLYKKEGRKLFLLENRTCWIALIGSHLLIYRNERHNQPYAIYPIRGYMARPAPNMIPRDRQKSESAFEIYRPGNETLRFIARTPKDMHQWVAKICEVGSGSAKNSKSAKIKERETRKKRRNDLVTESLISPDTEESQIVVNKSTTKATKNESASNKNKEIEQRDKIGNPPPLPARIPRRLPSLPPDKSAISPKATVEDDDDDDDIYHKIEDLKNGTCYQNMVLLKKQRADKKDETVAYDDVRGHEKSDNEEQKREEKARVAISADEMYDDIAILSQINVNNTNNERQNNDSSIANGEKGREELYDDVENLQNLVSNGKFAKNHAKDQIEISSKSPQKKSFLNRVLSRKESPGKSDKRCKGKVSLSPPLSSTKEDISTYDDASDLMPNRESSANEEEELPEYNCPPPPRPVYTKSIANDSNQIEEFYDDVNACREQYKNQMQTCPRSTQESSVKTKETMSNANTGLEANDDDPPQEEIEHYQSPRSDLCIRDTTEILQNEELYDDIALWADFTARQKDISGKKDTNEDATSKSTINSDKKSWNRFAVNRKSRASDSVETNRQSGVNECEEIEDFSERNSAVKRNTFQKLISKMENSLPFSSKVSARGNPSSFPNTDK